MSACSLIDESEQVSELMRLQTNIDWVEAGRRFTKAFWTVQYHLCSTSLPDYCLGTNLQEEVVACLLGGYGIKAELGLLAFHRMKNLRLIHPGVNLEDIEKAISAPFRWNGKYVHYRFSRQKAIFIFEFLKRCDIHEFDYLCGRELRNRLLTVKGIGPKTASWIARNHGNCEDVAIVDIHIYRAGRLAGFVDKKWNLQRDYYRIEESFLDFCHSINALPSRMDCIMWNQMKESNKRAIELLNLKD